jgi:hypothetical protein
MTDGAPECDRQELKRSPIHQLGNLVIAKLATRDTPPAPGTSEEVITLGDRRNSDALLLPGEISR